MLAALTRDTAGRIWHTIGPSLARWPCTLLARWPTVELASSAINVPLTMALKYTHLELDQKQIKLTKAGKNWGVTKTSGPPNFLKRFTV